MQKVSWSGGSTKRNGAGHPRAAFPQPDSPVQLALLTTQQLLFTCDQKGTNVQHFIYKTIHLQGCINVVFSNFSKIDLLALKTADLNG